MEPVQGMPWSNFKSALKKLSPKLHLAIDRPIRHPQYEDLILLGVWYGQKHICAVTFDAFVPYRDLYDEHGILTHRGLKTLLKYLLTYEWVPYDTATKNNPKGEFFKPEISIQKIRKAFGAIQGEVLHA